MEQKREVISVWPLNTGKHVKGLVKVIFGESITVFPLMLMEGKRGYYLSFPKIGQENKPIRPIGKFLYYEANRQLTEDVLRTYLPNTPLCREFRMKEALHIQCKVYPCDKRIDCMVARASIVLNQQIQIDGIRMFVLVDGVKMVLFPERDYYKHGEIELRRVVDFKNEKEGEIIEELWSIYDAMR